MDAMYEVWNSLSGVRYISIIGEDSAFFFTLSNSVACLLDEKDSDSFFTLSNFVASL